MRNYEEIIKKLEENKEYHNCFLNLLNKIEIKRKKDGSHFVNKNQTFVNANYTGDMNNTIIHPELKLCGQDKNGKWETYSIYCYIYCDELPKDDKRREKGISAGWSRDTYILTTDEIIERIEAEKERQKKYIEGYNLQIERSKAIFNKVDEKLKELRNLIKDETEDLRECNSCGKPIFPSSLEYALQDYIKDNIR